MENKNSGSIFKNAKKDKPTAPDYGGSATIDGKNYKMAAWVNKSKNMQNYLRILFTEVKQEQINQDGNIADQQLADDLPF